ncbi:MAG: M4 family metallopeptidase [Flavobacteriales bacterium]|nr:M4 family metallopeptidase [Flavobacteriales bacterium]
MKPIPLLAGLLLLALCSPEFGLAQIYHGQEAKNLVPGSELVKIRSTSAIPEFIRFRAGSELDVDIFQLWIDKVLKFDTGLSLELQKKETDNLGIIHRQYKQYYNGIPLEWSRYVAHERNGKIESVHGVIFKSINVPTSASITANQARSNALEFVNASTYKWEIPEEEALLKMETGQLGASYFPIGELLYLPTTANGAEFKLAYKFNIYAHEPLYRADVYVDATNGDILFENNRIHTADAAGTAVTAYSGTQPLTTDFTGSTYRLRETGRGNGIRTFNLQEGTNYGNAVDFTDSDNFWNNVNAQQDEVATDAHWGAEMTYDYFFLDHGRNSIDGAGFNLLSYIHYQSNYGNAFWDGQRMTYGDGSGSTNPFTALDIAGHEITHGLTTFTSNLVYSFESGALNESFSDIFGTSVEWFGKPGQANWLVGEDIGITLRSMSNPNIYGDPDTYLGTNWFTGTGDNGGVHTNSGVQNFWYYLLSSGGSGTNDNGDAYNVSALGITDAGSIAFRNNTVYLWPNSQYADARFYAIQSAIDIFGACSPEVIATTDAWYAVGVGPVFDSSVTAAFSANPTTSCSVPFTATFANNSTNGGTFIWDFGDGTTGTAANPSHTYTNYGSFTVKLVADGNPCGIDSVTQIAYVTIDSLMPCVVNLPFSGIATTQTACTGTLFDNGGANGTYADATNTQITIAPLGASSISLTIVSFDVEPGSGGTPPCDYDYVEFFDGPNTSSPSLGRFCNTTGPPVSPLTSSVGSITIYHHADPNVNGDGFEIQWNCVMPNQPPSTEFVANVLTTCTGDVDFTDLSVDGPTSWTWDFGDGGSSTQQNPSYIYTAAGTYAVELVTTNGFGSDSLTKTAYIAVNKPTAPTTTGASRCGNGSVSLSAAGTGTLTWYADSTGTNPIATGNAFTTPSLSTTTTYYVEDVIISPSQFVGPVDTSIGTGGNHTNTNFYQVFDCLSPFTLVSVDLYAFSTGYRTIELRNSAGVVLQDTNLNIPVGWQNLILDFDVPVGTDFQLRTGGMSAMFRNNTGPSYPYEIPGVISITGNNIPNPDFWYYYYNWEIRDPICRSELAPVVAAIGQDPVPTISNSTNVGCNGNCDGNAEISVNLGAPSYTYLWSNGQTTTSISSLCAGTYSVTITDANGCMGNTSVAITAPNALSFTGSVTDASCGNSNGSASVVVANGIPPYVYLWDDPAAQTTSTATGLTAANYICQITDANGCTTTANLVVSNTVPIVNITANTNVTCNGGNNGSATSLATLGVSPYTYAWNDPSAQTNATAGNLAAGTYSVTATDASGCFATDQITITEPAAISLNHTTTDASCNGACDGISTVVVTNGVGPLTYLWNDPGSQTTATANGLCDGTFNTVVTDANGCTANSLTTVNAGAGITINPTGVTNTNCGVCNGDASITVSGGTAPYTYLWNDPSAQFSALAINLCAGLYNVTATDAAGCTDVQTLEVFDGGGVFSNISTSTNVTCNGGTDGSATVVVTGGSAPYDYSWNDPANQTNATANNLAPGTYSVTAADTSGCITTSTVTIGEPDVLGLAESTTNASCGNADGIASVIVIGSTPAYTYLWSDAFGQTNASATGLSAGTYNVTVMDANGCTGIISMTLFNIGGPSVITTSSNITCNGDADGTASVTISGGTGPFNFLWDDGSTQTTQTAVGLAAGTYNVTVTDVNGCSTVNFTSVSEPTAVGGTTMFANATCGGSDGTATVTGNGGTIPYTYLWDDPAAQTTATCTGLGAGTYTATITDANGCLFTATVALSNTGGPTVNNTTSDVSCNGGSNGMVATSVSGGLSPYIYLWDDPAGQTTAIAQGLSAGTYNLQVTDNAGCIATTVVTINEPPALVVTPASTDIGAIPCSGTASVSASGGTPPYTYLWSSGQTTSSISNLCPGTYTATVTDGNGCDAIVTETVNSLVGISEIADMPVISVYPNPNSGKFKVDFNLTNRQDVYITLYSVTGRIVLERTVIRHKGTFEQIFDIQPQTAGIYMLRVVFDSGVIIRKVVRE